MPLAFPKGIPRADTRRRSQPRLKSAFGPWAMSNKDLVMNMVEIEPSAGCNTRPSLHPRSEAERYSIAMVAACPFPANHGSAASIREMSDTLSQMGHTVHIVTYQTGQQDIAIRHAKIHRTGPFRPETNAKVGPSPEKFLQDWALLRLLRRVIQSEQIDIIHAHNYEGALIGVTAKWLTRRPLLYNAVNLMSDELAGYHFIR